MIIDETEKEYHLVVGTPEPLNKERVTLWLEREGDTVVLLSQREGCKKIYEMRFKPNGLVICNSRTNQSVESNFRWS
jgi:hypothetical protein